MTDLLATLAARVAGTEAALSPVVGSIFDSPAMSASSGLVVEEALEEVIAPPPRHGRRDPVREEAAPPPARPGHRPRAAEPRRQPGLEPAAAGTPAPAAAPSGSPLPEPRTTGGDRLGQAESPAEVMVRMPMGPSRPAVRGRPPEPAAAEAPAVAAQVELAAASVDAVPPKATNVASAQGASAASPALESIPVQARRAAPPPGRPRESLGPLASSPPAATPMTSPQPPTTSPATPSLETADEMVVNVTIGRVELRSITPPAPTRQRPAPPARPFPSLEDYLQRTSGGYR